MNFTYSFSGSFAKEYVIFPPALQGLINDFIDVYEVHGLGNFSAYQGKIAYSWSGNISPTDPAYIFARSNELWHYHVGHPKYVQYPNVPYQVSDWLLHFQWPGQGSHIHIVEVYSHYMAGKFYLPPPGALAP